jgi:cytochrome c556
LIDGETVGILDHSRESGPTEARTSPGLPPLVDIASLADPRRRHMSRKWTILAAVMTAVVVTASGLTLAQDEDSPIHKIMEQVNSKSNAVKKVVRTAVAYKTGRKDIDKNAKSLIELAKKAREIKEPSEKQKRSFDEWQKLMDDFIKKTEEFKDLVAKPTTNQALAKKEFNGSVGAACTACHKVFRVDEDEDK